MKTIIIEKSIDIKADYNWLPHREYNLVGTPAGTRYSVFIKNKLQAGLQERYGVHYENLLADSEPHIKEKARLVSLKLIRNERNFYITYVFQLNDDGMDMEEVVDIAGDILSYTESIYENEWAKSLEEEPITTIHDGDETVDAFADFDYYGDIENIF